MSQTLAPCAFLTSSKSKIRRGENKAKVLDDMFEYMRDPHNIVIVEGKHDGIKMAQYGIPYLTFDRLLYDGHEMHKYGTAIILTDLDGGGDGKLEKIKNIIKERWPGMVIDEKTRKRFLGLIGVPCVEEIGKPLESILLESDQHLKVGSIRMEGN